MKNQIECPSLEDIKRELDRIARWVKWEDRLDRIAADAALVMAVVVLVFYLDPSLSRDISAWAAFSLFLSQAYAACWCCFRLTKKPQPQKPLDPGSTAGSVHPNAPLPSGNATARARAEAEALP